MNACKVFLKENLCYTEFMADEKSLYKLLKLKFNNI